MQIHNVKCWPNFFQSSKRGDKPFELRKNDRNYQVGDELHLHEWDPQTKEYSGRILVRTIGYILRPEDADAKDDRPLHPDYVILGL